MSENLRMSKVVFAVEDGDCAVARTLRREETGLENEREGPWGTMGAINIIPARFMIWTRSCCGVRINRDSYTPLLLCISNEAQFGLYSLLRNDDALDLCS